MKICRFEHNGQVQFGILKNDLIFPIDNIQNLKGKIGSNPYFETVKLNDVKLLTPIIPSKIVCVGRNYSQHAKELGNEVPKEPLLFLKAPSALLPDGEAVVLPSESKQVEHEGELGVVIGRVCKKLTENDNPFDYVTGYICLNDVTARDIQRKEIQFTRAKSFDTFCPVSLFIETELDVSDIRITTKVNGILKQDGKTSQMVFPVSYLVRYISNQMTLNVGDIIATGTPAGVSKLNDGDVCEVEIEGIGILRNHIINTEKL